MYGQADLETVLAPPQFKELSILFLEIPTPELAYFPPIL